MKNASRWSARVGLFGDLPGRVADQCLRVLPWFLEPVLVGGWTLLFFLIAGNQRRAVRGNLRAMFPDWGAARGTLGAWRVFWNFAVTYVDGRRCETGTGAVDWEVEGISHMEALTKRTDGCIVLTAHTGSYDIAAPMFAARITRVLHTVRAPEREPEAQRLREEEIRRKEERHPNFRTLWNRGDKLLGVELARVLNDGGLVAVQADRVVFDVSPMEIEVEPGLRMRLPKGPLVLARVTGATCYPVFITRSGWRRYRIEFQAPLELPPRVRGEDKEAAAIWADTVYRHVWRHWNQWFVFELALTRDVCSGGL
jgi:lauroyl/myristoyl acyltransferase